MVRRFDLYGRLYSRNGCFCFSDCHFNSLLLRLTVTWQYTVYPLVGTVESLFISYVVAWIVAGIANAICYAVVYKRFNKKTETAEELLNG